MHENVWKAFKDNPITHSGAHYLMTIHEMQERKWYARSSDIAKALEISAPSCSQSLKQLVKQWYLQMNEDKFYLLTQQWFQQVLLIEKNKEMLLKSNYESTLEIQKIIKKANSEEKNEKKIFN